MRNLVPRRPDSVVVRDEIGMRDASYCVRGWTKDAARWVRGWGEGWRHLAARLGCGMPTDGYEIGMRDESSWGRVWDEECLLTKCTMTMIYF